MAKSKAKEIKWLPDVDKHDYPAAESYLQLIYADDKVAAMVAKLRKAAVVQFRATDIFIASQLPLLGVGNSHVKEDRKKVRKGISLSPLLLVRDESNGKVVIADGYHRLCAIYDFDEDALIYCKII